MGPTLRERLDAAPLLGTFVKLPRPEVVDLAALAGFDFLVLDLEHGQGSYAEARETLLAGRAAGIDVVVRMGVLDPALANRLLEAGAAGIQLSSVTSSSQAHHLRDALRYQPGGERSISLAQPAAKYGGIPLKTYLESFSERPLVVGQFETVDYADDLGEICKPLDVAFLGPADLSVAAGTPGSIADGDAARTVAALERATNETRTHLGTFVGSPSAARDAFKRGYRYVVVTSDLAMLGSALRDAVQAVRS